MMSTQCACEQSCTALCDSQDVTEKERKERKINGSSDFEIPLFSPISIFIQVVLFCASQQSGISFDIKLDVDSIP